MNFNKDRTCGGRPRLQDFDGRLLSLDTSPLAWECLNPESESANLLLLGTGPENPAFLPFVQKAMENNQKIYWLENAELLKKYSLLPSYSTPTNNWHKIEKEEAEKIARESKVFFYKPGLRLVPDFWQELLGKIAIASNNLPCRKKPHEKIPRVWLPGNDRQLLWLELYTSLEKMGFAINSDEIKENGWPYTGRMWHGEIPDFAISVNFRGLDSDGHIASLCKALNIPLAIWLVDNPWNLLSAIRLPWWKQACLFVTDASFIKELQTYGAQHVEFCPLAVAPHMQRPIPDHASSAPLFVGRSSFPDKNRFFSGVRLPTELAAKAEKMLEANKKPDFHWWIGENPVKLWPGKQGRLPAFCADTFSAKNRTRWLQKAPENLLVIGDENWKQLLPGRRILPLADYYGTVPEHYRHSLATLNVTSWLLPESLNQRHFDVWAAGGFLLTDYSEGLKLFPDDLTREITLSHPEEFEEKLNYFQSHQSEANELRHAWRETLNQSHLYRHRIEKIMHSLDVPIPEN